MELASLFLWMVFATGIYHLYEHITSQEFKGEVQKISKYRRLRPNGLPIEL